MKDKNGVALQAGQIVSPRDTLASYRQNKKYRLVVCGGELALEPSWVPSPDLRPQDYLRLSGYATTNGYHSVEVVG